MTTAVVSADPLLIHDMVQVGVALVALATVQDRTGGVIVRSEDGGLSWSQSPTPLPGSISGECPPIDGVCGFTSCPLIGPGCDLMAAGSWLVAVRSSGYLNDSAVLDQQAAFVSDDLGTTWQSVDLPAPADTEPFVWSAAEVDERLILGGTTQAFFALEDRQTLRRPASGPDAALWLSTDPAAGFERLAEEQFDGVPGAERISELVAFDGRLIAIGAEAESEDPGCCRSVQIVAHESDDAGDSWSPMDGLSTAEQELVDVSPRLVGDNLVLRGFLDRAILGPGSDRWEVQPLLTDIETPFVNQVGLADDSEAVTWVENSACDCSVGYAGLVEDGELVSESRLTFDSCVADEAVRPDTSVFAPGVIGNQVVALASCAGVASVAFSLDGSRTWETMPLPSTSPRDGGLAVQTFRFLPEQNALVVLLAVLGTDSAPEAGVPAQIVSVRISVAG